METKIYGELTVNSYDCEGNVYYSESTVFNGDTFTAYYTWYEDGQPVTETDGPYPVSDAWGAATGGCAFIDGVTPMLRATFCMTGGYGPYGGTVDMYTYGTFPVDFYEVGYEGDCYYDEEYDEWQGEGPTVCTSYPKAYFVVTRRSENEGE